MFLGKCNSAAATLLHYRSQCGLLLYVETSSVVYSISRRILKHEHAQKHPPHSAPPLSYLAGLYTGEGKRHLSGTPLPSQPRPHIAGTLPARVTAAENCTYAYIDDMGRYRVKLPFDLDEWSPGGESRPVRLAKPYAGPEYGIHFPLHEGTEVMLAFVQGNPDRPYISGVMHDSAHPDHIPADWNTRNVIRTWSNNKLRMEDQKGREHIKLATD